MLPNNQTSWTTSLQKAKQNLKRNSQISLQSQKQRIFDELNYYKQQVIKTAKNKDYQKTKDYFLKLIDARAKQSAIALEEIKRKEGTVSIQTQKQIIQEYQKDCAKLAIFLDSILEIKNK